MWNTHRIRAQKNTNLPDGVPNHIYSFPELYELEDKGAFHINKFYVLQFIPVVSLHSVHVILVYLLFIMQHLVGNSADTRKAFWYTMAALGMCEFKFILNLFCFDFELKTTLF